MNLLRAHRLLVLPARLQAVFVSTPLLTALLLLAVLTACGGVGGSASSGKTKRLRLAVGQIKEVDFRLSADTTLHLYSSSDNKEIVDVSRAESAPEDVAARPTKGTDRAVFYIKGISPGRASVVFSEKKNEQEGSGRALSTYSVEIVSK